MLSVTCIHINNSTNYQQSDQKYLVIQQTGLRELQARN